ncbi:threonine/serine ThrE exporter family protein [Mycoplasma elephantis]|uniref:threonine/serine ThrE exporter family protein n=1 Tax=Mycoplasma elephantis TaxID=114882 RepID=UPI00055FD039|nr:threonine/serine exporter family protein [Mycoplasma elephantis]
MEKDKKIFDIALLAGQILMESGAESYRVEDVLERILSLSDYETKDALALLTSFNITLKLKNGTVLTSTKRIKERNVHLDKIQQTNQISRLLISNQIDLEKAENDLKLLLLDEKPLIRNYFLKILAAGSFTLMQGGLDFSLFVSLSAAIIMIFVDLIFKKTKIANFIKVLLQAFSASLFSALIIKYFPNDVNLISTLTGCLMILFPGTVFTNAIRDILNGDFLTGSGNILSAIVTASSLALGTGIALYVVDINWVDIQTNNEWYDKVASYIGAAIAVICVAFILGVKGFVPIYIGFLGAVGWVVYCLLFQSKTGVFVASFVGALCLAFFAQIGARIFKAPSTIFFIPSLFPLVPGAIIYKAIVLYSQNNYTDGNLQFLDALIISIGIALGIMFIDSLFTFIMSAKKILFKYVKK